MDCATWTWCKRKEEHVSFFDKGWIRTMLAKDGWRVLASRGLALKESLPTGSAKKEKKKKRFSWAGVLKDEKEEEVGRLVGWREGLGKEQMKRRYKRNAQRRR